MPGKVTLAQVCRAIEAVLATASTEPYSQDYSELTEAVVDLPMLQVYPQSGRPAATLTDRATFGGGGVPMRQMESTIHVDYYARVRSHIGEDMAALVDGIDALQDIFEAQDKKPYFGLEGLRAFAWQWDRVQFEYADQKFVGARFILTVRVF